MKEELCSMSKCQQFLKLFFLLGLTQISYTDGIKHCAPESSSDRADRNNVNTFSIIYFTGVGKNTLRGSIDNLERSKVHPKISFDGND